MAAETLTRSEQIDRYVELFALWLVLSICRCYNEVEYIEAPRGLNVFDTPILDEFNEYLDRYVDDVAHELWPAETDLDADPEFREASSRGDVRTAEVFASLARAQEYFLDEAIRFSKLAGTRLAAEAGADDA